MSVTRLAFSDQWTAIVIANVECFSIRQLFDQEAQMPVYRKCTAVEERSLLGLDLTRSQPPGCWVVFFLLDKKCLLWHGQKANIRLRVNGGPFRKGCGFTKVANFNLSLEHLQSCFLIHTTLPATVTVTVTVTARHGPAPNGTGHCLSRAHCEIVQFLVSYRYLK